MRRNFIPIIISIAIISCITGNAQAFGYGYGKDLWDYLSINPGLKAGIEYKDGKISFIAGLELSAVVISSGNYIYSNNAPGIVLGLQTNFKKGGVVKYIELEMMYVDDFVIMGVAAGYSFYMNSNMTPRIRLFAGSLLMGYVSYSSKYVETGTVLKIPSMLRTIDAEDIFP